MNRLRFLASSLVITTLALCAPAHDTWLIPNSFVVDRDSVVTLNLTSGMAFPELDTSINSERIDLAVCRLAGRKFELKDYTPAPKSLVLKAPLAEPGVATIWVELKPKSLELTPKLVKEYLDEIGAPDAIRQRWANAKRPRRWRETYTKHAKTFVRVGESQSDGSWAEPVGLRLEIVPLNDPTRLRSGDELAVRVLKNGKPLAGISVGIVCERDPKGELLTTDAEGRATFRLNRAGSWLVRVTALHASSQAGTDWESDFTTLTIQVGASDKENK